MGHLSERSTSPSSAFRLLWPLRRVTRRFERPRLTAATRPGVIKSELPNGRIHQSLKLPVNVPDFRFRNELRPEHRDEVSLAIDPEERRRISGPSECPGGSGHVGRSSVQPHGPPITKTVSAGRLRTVVKDGRETR